jgi:hypothetical protein
MCGFQRTFVTYVTTQSNESSDGEEDIKFHQEDEPIVKVFETDEDRAARDQCISDNLAEEYEPKRSTSDALASATPTPTSNRPNQETAAIKQDR